MRVLDDVHYAVNYFAHPLIHFQKSYLKHQHTHKLASNQTTFSNMNNTISLVLYLLIVFIILSVHSTPLGIEDSPIFKLKSADYKRLASHCYIDDYAAWLERQQELLVWLNLAKLLKLPIQDSKLIQQELEQFRLQYECLRVIERLPVSIGPG